MMLRPVAVLLAAGVFALGCASQAGAEDLFKAGTWPSLASDAKALAAGDSMTVVVIENSTATNTTLNGSKKGARLSGQLTYGDQSEGGGVDLSGASEGGGQTGRSGRMIAQIGVIVTEVLPNGDLRIEGSHTLTINGETTHIKLRGRVRRIDIGSDNSVFSNRLSETAIDYDGSGFLTRSAKPGLLSQIFSFLGLM